jgi:hypothetical protein
MAEYGQGSNLRTLVMGLSGREAVARLLVQWAPWVLRAQKGVSDLAWKLVCLENSEVEMCE